MVYVYRENKEKVMGVGWNIERYDTGGGLRPRTGRPGTCCRENWISLPGYRSPPSRFLPWWLSLLPSSLAGLAALPISKSQVLY